MRADQLTEPVTDHGEGPAWDPERGVLRFVDMLRGDLLSLDVDAGAGAGHWLERRHVGTVAAVWRPRVGGGGIVALERGFAFVDASGEEVVELGDLWTDDLTRMNDGGCDPQGRFYCGSMAYDETPGAGSVYRLDPDLSVHVVLRGVTISNGLTWSLDGDRAFYADTPTGRIDVFDFDSAAGEFTGRRPFAEIDPERGGPDGITIDAEGGIWVALWDGSAVHRYAADGTLDQIVELPVTQVTACTFGGPDLDRLYITTSARDTEGAQPGAGAIFVVEPGVRGMPPHPYRG